MSLNNMTLPPSLLAELYTNTLIEPKVSTLPEPENISFLGKNEKRITMIVAHEKLPFLPDKELNFLTSILTACKLSLADIAIVNQYSNSQGNMQEALEKLEARQVILFGVPPLTIGLPMNFPPFQIQNFDRRTYLFSPPLDELESNKETKQKLWSCLKNMFGLK